jgi:hypothetical protein
MNNKRKKKEESVSIYVEISSRRSPEDKKCLTSKEKAQMTEFSWNHRLRGKYSRTSPELINSHTKEGREACLFYSFDPLPPPLFLPKAAKDSAFFSSSHIGPSLWILA